MVSLEGRKYSETIGSCTEVRFGGQETDLTCPPASPTFVPRGSVVYDNVVTITSSDIGDDFEAKMFPRTVYKGSRIRLGFSLMEARKTQGLIASMLVYVHKVTIILR